MTPEEKAKAYDEAIRKLRGMMPNWGCLSYNGKTFLQDLIHIFPELAESEDELTWLTKYIEEEAYSLSMDIRDNEDRIKLKKLQKALAWLENIPHTIDREKREGFQLGYKAGLEKQGGIDNCPLEDSADCVTTDSRKQGEQNHSEQDLEMVAKPKFNIGDWITSDEPYINNDYRLCKVVGISDGCYTIQTIDGLKGYNTFKGWESEYRLWSIEDAKDGDVLVCPLKYEAGEQIFIFKGINSRDYVDNCIEYYCRICQGVFYENEIGFMGTTDGIFHPATKEQRDILFQKMHEAFYTFDFEKKELKKLKFRVGDEVITENEGSLTITKIDEEGYWSNDLFICDFDSECILDIVEQKPYVQRKECLDCQFNYVGECKGSCAIKRGKQKSALDIEIPFGAKDSELQEATYLIPEGFHAEIKYDEVLIKKGKQEPAWTKMDEEILSNAIFFIREYQTTTRNKTMLSIAKEAENWLLTLKKRIV